jgi:DNA-binding response OmpR family regulator
MKRALVVEDTNTLLFMTKAFALRSGFEEVDAVTTAEEALELFEKGKYDLISIDIGLPYMNGLELCLKIREQDKDVYIMALTGHEEIVKDHKYQLAGFNDAYVKPLGYTDFLDAIEKIGLNE